MPGYGEIRKIDADTMIEIAQFNSAYFGDRDSLLQSLRIASGHRDGQWMAFWARPHQIR